MNMVDRRIGSSRKELEGVTEEFMDELDRAHGTDRFNGTDRSHVTDKSEDLQVAGQRSRRLAVLQASIQAGTYHVSSDVLAACLMRRMLQTR